MHRDEASAKVRSSASTQRRRNTASYGQERVWWRKNPAESGTKQQAKSLFRTCNAPFELRIHGAVEQSLEFLARLKTL